MQDVVLIWSEMSLDTLVLEKMTVPRVEPLTLPGPLDIRDSYGIISCDSLLTAKRDFHSLVLVQEWATSSF